MKIYFVLFCFSFTNLFFGQTAIKNDSVLAKKIKLFNTNFKEFEVVGDEIYALTKGDSLIVFNFKKDKITKIKSGVISIVKNNRNEIIFIDKQNKIIHYKNRKKEKIKIKSDPYKLILDGNNIPVLISNKGLIYNNKLFEPTNIEYNYRYYGIKSLEDRTRVFSNPDLVYLDSKNRLWLTYDRGEFGEDILFFDLERKVFFEDEYLLIDVDYQHTKANRNRYFQDLKKAFPNKIKETVTDTLYKFPYQIPIRQPIRGIVEKEGKFFISQSLMHFSVTSNLLVLYDFDNEEFYKSTNIECELLECDDFSFFGAIEFLGSISLNKFNNSIYYYSHKGFFKIKEAENTFDKEFVFRPWILWSATNRNNLGYDINVTKFEFISENELIFLTTNNGIGYYNGTEVKYFQ